jgi:hypothetical protein
MSDKKISQLTNLAANNANSADFLPIVNNGVTKRITIDALKTVLGQLGYVFNNVVFSQADEPLTTPNTLYVYNEKLFYVDSAQNSLEVNIKGNDSVSNTVTLINQPTTEDFLPNTLFIHNDQFYWTDDNAQAFSVVGNAQNANLLSLTLTNQIATTGYQENTLFTHGGKLYLASSEEVAMPIATEGNAVSFNKISLLEQQGLSGQPAKTLITFNGNLYFVDEENLARKVVLNDTEPKFNEIQLNESASLEGFSSNTLVVKENKLYFIDELQNAVAIAFGDYLPENEANKATDFTVVNNVLYPTTLATDTQIDTKIAALVNSAPSALNTLNELANALGSDPNFATTTSTALGERELISNKSIDVSTDATSDTKYPSVKAVKTYADTKQDNLGFTPENVSNKDTDGTLAANSDTKYPSQKAVKTYVDTKQDTLGYTPENVTNKSTSVIADQTSNTKYPSVKSVFDWVTGLVSGLISGSGTSGKLTRWTGAGTVGDSIIHDNGTSIGIGTSASANSIVSVINSSKNQTITADNSFGSDNGKDGMYITVSGNGIGNNSGVRSYVSGSSSTNHAFYGIANGATSTNIGGFFAALDATYKYAIQLQDGSQGEGKFLKSVTADGSANWATINEFTADATPDAATDYVMTYDASAGTHKKVLLSNLPASSGAGNALTSNPLSQFASTTSAQLATVISDETGSGALVFGTSPTLSNPIVGTQTANDNSTKAASTAYVDSAISTAASTYKVAKKLQINCKTAASSLIFTTEANKGRFVVTDVWFHADTITSLGFSAPSISVGHTSSNYADFVSNQALPNSSWAANQFKEVTLRSEGSSRISCPASTGIYVKVVTASDATAYTGTVFIEGFYIG